MEQYLGKPRILCLGDSLTYAPNLGVSLGNFYPAQLRRALRGEQWSAVVSVAGAVVNVGMDAGAFFQPGTLVQFMPPQTQFQTSVGFWSVPPAGLNRNRRRGAAYVVRSRSGDALTLDRAPPATLPAGWQIVGLGNGPAPAVQVENGGHSGYTSAQILLEIARWVQYGLPRLAIIAAGTNDANAQGSSTVQASPTPTATTFSLGSGAGATVAAPGSFVDVGANLACEVLSVSGDAVTLKTALGAAPTAGTTVAINTRYTLAAIGRRLLWMGTPMVMLGGKCPVNASSGGDWTGSAIVLTAGAATLRTAQLNAAADIGAPFADIPTRMAARVPSVDAGGSGTLWNILDGNTHKSEYGHRIEAMIYADVISQQPGWLAALA